MKLHTNINLLLRVKSFNKGIVANHKEKKKKKKKKEKKEKQLYSAATRKREREKELIVLKEARLGFLSR